jgi:hypothetical protein
MPAVPSMGVVAHLGMDDSSTATEEYEFLSCGMGLDQEIQRTEGIRGTRLHPVERLRQGRKTPGGTITLEPVVGELANLLKRCIGAVSTITYTVSDTQPAAFEVWVDKVAKVHRYTSCRVDRARFHAVVGKPLELTLEVEALTESIGNAASFPSLTPSLTAPYVLFDGVLTLAGSAVQVVEWECVVDWHLKKDRFVNSQTRTSLPSMDLTVSTRFVVPYTSDTTALYNGGDAVTGVTGNINFTVGGAGGGAAGTNLKFTYANLVFPAQRSSPIVASRDEILLTLAGEARKSSTTAPLAVECDVT